MRRLRAISLIPILCLGVTGCYTAPKDIPIYSGLVPANYQVKVSNAPIDPAALKSKRLFVVTSENFNAYAKEWTDIYEKGGINRSLGGAVYGGQAYAGVASSSDPRLLTDEIVASLRPYFSSVGAATDFASAKEQGADYFAVLDYRVWYNPVTYHLLAHGQLNLLDGQLNEMAAMPANSDHGINSLSGVVGGVSAGIDDDQKAKIRARGDISTQIQAGLTSRLGPSR